MIHDSLIAQNPSHSKTAKAAPLPLGALDRQAHLLELWTLLAGTARHTTSQVAVLLPCCRCR
jgi:hypothetical protein